MEIKIHLGCGSRYFDGYINIDSSGPPSRKVDIVMDVFDIGFEENTITEIRHHHLFEHFHRYEAVALMAGWNRWLIPHQGRLIIETPNFEACCRVYLDPNEGGGQGVSGERNKWLVLRHLYGSKEADWATHLEGWDHYTLRRLFELFGFKVVHISESIGPLACVTITGEKIALVTKENFLPLAEEFLRPMVVNDFEMSIWLNQAAKAFEKLVSNPLLDISRFK